MKEIEREIEVVESIIKVLNRCLAVNLTEKQIENIKNNIRDIDFCENELKRLIEVREAALVAKKGKIQDVSAI